MRKSVLNKLYVGDIRVPVNGNLTYIGTYVFYKNKRNHFIEINSGNRYSLLSENDKLPIFRIVPESLVLLKDYALFHKKENGDVLLNGTRQKKVKLMWHVK